MNPAAPMPVKLLMGKLPPVKHKNTIPFGSILKEGAPLPIPPVKNDYELTVPDSTWSATMFGNDQVGDCAIAGPGHEIMCETANAGSMFVPAIADIMKAYSAVSGYDPTKTLPDGSNPTDAGCVVTDVLEYRRTTGIAGHKIDGWVGLDTKNAAHLKLAMYLFGNVGFGFNLPASAMDQFQARDIWDVVAEDGGIIGGHYVPFFGYNPTTQTGITWARRQAATWNFVKKYADEAYSTISLDWITKSGLSPSHLNMQALESALSQLKLT